MTGSWWRALLLAVFLIAALVLPGVDQSIARDLEHSRWLEKMREATLQIGRDLEKEAESLVQVEILVKELHRRATAFFKEGDTPQARRRLEALYQQEFREVLPKHDVGFALPATSPEGIRLVFRQFGNLTLNEPFLRLLFKGLVNPPEEFSEPEMTHLETAFRKTIGFPISRAFLQLDSGLGLHHFNCGEGRKILYTQTDPPRTPRYRGNLKSILGVLIDAERIPDTFGMERIVTAWNRPGLGVGFVPRPGGQAYFSGYFAKRPGLMAFLRQAAGQGGPTGLILENPRQLIFAGKPILGGKYRPVVVRSLVSRPPTSGLSNQGPWVFSLMAVALVSLTLLRRKLSGYRPRISVGALLATVFAVVAILPMMGVSSITRFIMAEEERRESNQAQIELQERLKSYDDLVRFFQAGYIQALRRTSSHPNLGNQLRKEELAGRDLGLLQNLAAQARRSFSFGEISSIGGVLLAVGPGNFSRCWTKPREDQPQKPEDIAQFLVPIMNKALHRLRQTGDGARRIGDPAESVRQESGSSREELQYEMVREMIIKLMGPESFFTLLYYPGRLDQTQLSLGRVSFMQFPIRFEGWPRYLLTWVWDETSIRQACLDFFREKIPVLPDYRVFVTFAREFGFRHQPEGLERIPELFEAMVRCQATGAEIQRRIETASGQIVLASTPSVHASEAYFSGIRFLPDTTVQTRTWFRKTLFSGLLLAFFLATAATLVFMSPLRRLMSAIQAIRQGNLDARLGDEQRQDEFGTLAVAFNFMAKGLREKELLNRYVSPSVRRMISDPAFFQAARDGEVREVTVLFTGMHEFEAFQDTHATEDVFRLINAQLEILNAAVEEFGGEISKVIGEKIMVVFDHRDLGSGERAVLAAVNVIRKARADGGVLPLTPVFGLNSGPVVAGIIGSPNVRRDYTVIGDTVNLASRLASLAHSAGTPFVVLSDNTRRLAPPDVDVEILPVRGVKGKTQAVEAFLLHLPATTGTDGRKE